MWVVVDRDHHLVEIDAATRKVRKDIALTPNLVQGGRHVTGGGVIALPDGSAWVTMDGF